MLDDATRTAVISQRGMGQAIGFSRRGSRLTVFVNSQTMDGYIGRDLREKLENPLVFQPVGAAAGAGVSSRAYGYDATILIDLCRAIIEAKAGGARALRIQLRRVLEMAESSTDKQTYERKIVDRFGGQKEFEFIIPKPSAAQGEAAN